MKPLTEIKRELWELVPSSIADTIKALKKLLPDESEKYQDALALEGRLNETNKNRLLGVISDEQLQLRYNRIRKDLLEMITHLEESDFDLTQANTQKSKQKQAKKGSILYRIPGTMPLGKESKCIVRIALDKETIIQNIDIDEHLQLKDIRVSEIMHVALVDPSKEQPFSIQALSSPEQFIEEGEYTEWLFYVEPLKEGIFPLMLKVSVIELIQGNERKREIVLEEQVQIVTEGAVEDVAAQLQPAGYSFSFSTAQPMDIQYVDSVLPSIPSTPSTISTPSTSKSGFNRAAMLLLALLVVATGSWALTSPETKDWLRTRYWLDTPEAYEAHLEKHPDSRHKEKALIRLAKKKNTLESYQKVIQEVKDESLLAEARQGINMLAEAKWQTLADTSNLEQMKTYLAEFPVGKYAEKAAWQLTLASEDSLTFDDYILDYPRSVYVAEALQKVAIMKDASITEPSEAAAPKRDLEELFWDFVENQNTERAYAAYLERYPDGKYIHEAEANSFLLELAAMKDEAEKEKRFWEWCKAQKSKRYNEVYLKKYPYGDYVDEAIEQVFVFEQEAEAAEREREDRFWNWLLGRNILEGYQVYLQKYPEGHYRQEADSLIAYLTEKAFWVNQIEKGDKAAMQVYLEQYPQGRYVERAQEELEALRLGEIRKQQKRKPVYNNRTYKTVRLNGKTWLAENLAIAVEESWCYDDDPANCQKYGRLYTWEAAKKACTKLGTGWRLPSDEEWKTLVKSFGGYYDGSIYKDIGDPKKSYKALLNGGNSGFSALLGGNRAPHGGYYSLDDNGGYWSSTEYDADEAWYFNFHSTSGELYRNYSLTSIALSCRCIKD